MNNKFIILFILISFYLGGCTVTREQIKYRDEFFTPVVVIPQRNQAVLSADASQLKLQLEHATYEAIMLQDSLKSLKGFTSDLLTSTRSLIEKVSELETRDFLTNAKHKELEQSIAQLKYENKQLAQQLNEIRSKLIVDSQPSATTSIFSTAKALSSLHDEYNEGLSLFHQRRYVDAYNTFSSLIDKGIEEDLSDNCEYWKGECSFAKKEYNSAIISFQKVLEIKTSNKKVDAYFMLGKSYEQIGEYVKARWVFEELNLLYPDNIHSRTVKAKLRTLQKLIPESRKNNTIDRSSI